MTEVAEELVQAASTELTVQARAAIALASDKTRQDLMAMATKYATITEIKNKAGRDECHSAAITLAGARIAISKTGKAARDDATKFSKAVIDEEKSLIAITEPEEKRLLALRDKWDEVVAAEKAARELAERNRITAIHKRIAAIREFVALAAACRTAARVDELLTKLSLTSLADFEEFSDEAAAAHMDAMERVNSILVEKHQIEAEQERIKQAQAEAAARLATERAEFEAAQALARAEADRLAKEHADQVAADTARARAEADKLAAELAQQRAELEAEAKRQSDALAAERAAQAEAQQRALQEAKDAQDKRDAEAAAERKKLDDERAAFEAQVAEQAAITQAAIEQARQVQSLPVELLDQLSETVAFIAAPETVTELATANAEQAQVTTQTIAPETIEQEPSDADVMWTAISAVAKEYRWTTKQATERLQAVKWTI